MAESTDVMEMETCPVSREQVLACLRLFEAKGFVGTPTPEGFVLPGIGVCYLERTEWYHDCLAFHPGDWVHHTSPDVHEALSNVIRAVLDNPPKKWEVVSLPNKDQLLRLIEAMYPNEVVADHVLGPIWSCTPEGALRLSCRANAYEDEYQTTLFDMTKPREWGSYLKLRLAPHITTASFLPPICGGDLLVASRAMAFTMIRDLARSLPFLVAMAGGSWKPIESEG